MKISKYSFGTGDRFGCQGKAQLEAVIKAKQDGIDITPVWNKSYREHSIIGTDPADVRKEADESTKAKSWQADYFVDADHINLGNVDGFIDHSDFFTLDVADYIGQAPDKAAKDAFIEKYSSFIGKLEIPNIAEPFEITEQTISACANKFLFAVKQAGDIYRHIESKKGRGNFVTEVSMDETDQPQNPVEMLFILAMIADESIPAQTIAPKFTGRFNKGVDYVGDVSAFEKEFNADLMVIDYAAGKFGLPENLKLSVHSGSDKFAIYPAIKSAIKKYDKGVHIKTAGTTWLEEIIGLAEAGGSGLDMAKDIYAKALEKFDELCKPYATVIDIDRNNLPSAEDIKDWDSKKMSQSLRHDQGCADFNADMRQLFHVGYKIAAMMGDDYYSELDKHEDVVAKNVTENLYDRHIKRIFID